MSSVLAIADHTDRMFESVAAVIGVSGDGNAARRGHFTNTYSVLFKPGRLAREK
jgi:hypothetical protein